MLWWYAQNLLLFVHEETAFAYRDIPGFNEAPSLIHPKLYAVTRRALISGTGQLAR